MSIWSARPIHSTLPPRASTICDDGVAVLAVLGRAGRTVPSAPRLELQQVEHDDRTLVGRARELEELVLVRADCTHRLLPSSSASDHAFEHAPGARDRCSPARCAGGSRCPTTAWRRARRACRRRDRETCRRAGGAGVRSSRARFAAIVGESCTLSSAARRTGVIASNDAGAARDDLGDRARHGSPPGIGCEQRANRSDCRCATSARSASTSSKWLCTDRADTPAARRDLVRRSGAGCPPRSTRAARR